MQSCPNVYKFIFTLFRFFTVVPILLFAVFTPVHAWAETNQTINFQGKLVDSNGLNVSDGTAYQLTFKLYNVASSGTAIWTEVQSNVTVTSGIFQVQLGSVTPLTGVDFNNSSLYLGITVTGNATGGATGESEMTPRIQFTAVPYAFNAASLQGVVATQSATGYTLTGGYQNPKTLTLNDNITLGLTITPTASNTLTVKSNGANGLTLDTGGAAALNIGASANAITIGNNTFANNTAVTITTGGSGIVTIGSNTGTGNVVVQPNAGGQAALIVNDQGNGDVFTASVSGSTKFVVNHSGYVGIDTASPTAPLTLIGNALITNAPTAGVAATATKIVTGDPNTKGLIIQGTTSSGNNFPSTNIAAYYKFDENSGSTVGDSINSNNGTWQGTLGSQWTTGIINSGGSFNGSNNYVSVANNSVQNAYPFSISFWVNSTLNSASQVGLVTKYVSGSSNGYNVYIKNGHVYGWYLASSSNYVYNLSAGDGVDGGLINDGNWHHVVFTVDANGGKIYVDNSLKNTMAWVGTPTSTSTTQGLNIGYYTSSGTYFSGKIDEVGIWGRALSSTDVTTLYNSGLGLEYGSQSQVANLQEWQNSSASVLAAVDTSGNILPGTTTTENLGSSSLLWNNVYASTILTSGNTGLNLYSAGSGSIIMGQNTGTGNVLVQPNAGGQAALIVNGQGNGDLLTASASGSTKFTVTNGGNIRVVAGAQLQPLTDSTTALQITNAAGTTPFINLDTTNSYIKLGTGTSVYSGGTCKGSGASEACAPLHFVTTSNNYGSIFENTSGPNILTFAHDYGGVPYEFTVNVGSVIPADFSLSDSNGNKLFYISQANDYFALGKNNTSPVAPLDVKPSVYTSPVASMSGATGKATLVVDQSGVGDIFTASQSGGTRFVIQQDGSLIDSKYITSNGLFYADSTGKFFQLAPTGTSSQCLTSGVGNQLVWSSCSGSGLTLQQVFNNGQTIDLSGAGIAANLTLGTNAGIGNIIVSPNAGGQAALMVNDQGVGDLFTASASGNTKFTIASNGLVTDNGAIRITGGSSNTDTFTTPVGSSVTTKINVPYYDPGAYNQIVAMGLPSSANANARVLSLFDARTVSHQPTLAIFTPDENNVAGLSWEGSNSDLSLKNSVSSGSDYINFGGTNTVGFSTGAGITLFKGYGYGGGHLNQTLLYIGAGGTTPNAASLAWGDGTGWKLNFGYSNGSAVFTPTFSFEDAGRLGIGTTNLLSTLDIRGDRYTTPVASMSGATGEATLVVDQSGVGDLFTASVSGAPKFVINNSGNVGIGTNTPGNPLSITAPSSLGTAAISLTTSTNLTTDSQYIGINAQRFNLGYSGTNGLGFINVSPGKDIEIQTNCATVSCTNSDLFISRNSFVGINTSSTGNAQFVINQSGVGDILSASVSGSPKFVINNSGFVGIGTNVPTFLLSLSGSDSQANGGGAGIKLSNTASGGGNWYIRPGATGTNTPAGGLSIANDTNYWLNLSAYGNVGLGTSAVGNAALVVNQTNSQGLGDLFTASASGNTRFVISNAGYVGLGTNTPSYPLQISNSFGTIPSATIDYAINSSVNGSGASSNDSSLRSFGFTVIGSGSNQMSDVMAINGDVYNSLSTGGVVLAQAGSSVNIRLNGAGNTTNAFGYRSIPILSSTGSISTAYEAFNARTPQVTGAGTIGTAYGLYVEPQQVSGVTTAYGLYEAGGVDKNYLAGNLGIGSTAVGNSGLVVNQTNNQGLGDIFTASSSGVTQFLIANSGSVGINVKNSASLLGTIDIRGESYTTPVATISGATGKAALQVDNSGIGDLFTASQSGNTQFVITNNGKVGIGNGLISPTYRLDVQDNKSATAAAQIWNTAANNTAGHTGLIIRLGTAGSATAANTSDRFIQFMRGDGNVVGKIQGGGTAPNTIQYTATGTDFGEYFQKADENENFAFGDVVCIDQTKGGVTACAAPNTQIVGVVSDRTSFVGGVDHEGDAHYVLVGLTGQIPTTVSAENGSIAVGDPITVSSVSGVGAKATKAGFIVGKALASFSGSGTGKIMVAVATGFSGGTEIADMMSGLQINDGNVSQDMLSWLMSHEPATASSQLSTDRLVAGLEVITPKVTTDQLSVNKVHITSQDGLSDLLSQISTSSSAFTVSGLTVNGLATVSADLRVQGNGLFEGVLSVIDTLRTSNLIVSSIADFFDNVVFHKDVTFAGRPTFNSDTAGFATVHAGANRVDVSFAQAYATAPVVSASLMQPDVLGTSSATSQNDLQQKILSQGYTYIVTNRTSTGFSIVLNKPATSDVAFSWTALAITNPMTAESTQSATLTPTPTIIPTPTPSVSMSVAPTP